MGGMDWTGGIAWKGGMGWKGATGCMRRVRTVLREPALILAFAVLFSIPPFRPLLPFPPLPPLQPTQPASAQGRRPMSLLDIAELPRLLNPQLSPDGRTLVYHRSHADWQVGAPVWNVWRQDIGGAPRPLTFSSEIAAPGALRWSPDGRSISFLRAGQIYLMPSDGGEPRALTHHATPVYPPVPPVWSPDSTAMYFVASEARTTQETARARVRDDVFAFEEDFKQRQLWKVIVATGAETQVTSGDASVLSFRLSRDGRQITLERAPTPLEGDKHRAELWLMDADGGNARALTRNSVAELDPELSPDGRQVLFRAETNGRFEPYYSANVFLVPASGGPARMVLPDFKYEIEQATWAPDGRSIYAIANMGVHNELFQIDPASGRFTQLTDGKHFIVVAGGGWSVVAAANRMVLQLDEPTRFGDVYTMSIGGGRDSLTRVTSAFDSLERDFILPRQEKVEWKSTDGTTIEGMLFYPLDYQPGKRYPLVVQMHGGPADSDKFGAGAALLQNYFPVLAARGYAVLRPNYRGSTGYGNAFLRDVNDGYFHHMQDDVLSGVDALVKQGIADPDRLVLMGWSAGGHLANKLITVTTRFKAASSGAAVADWISFWAQTDSTTFRRTWFGGTPWQKDAPIALFWDSSPLKDVATVKTPTLFFVGENDVRVPQAQSVEMYRALTSHHVPTRLLVAPREGHQWGELRHLLLKANTELEWFDRYALGRAYTWEKAP